MSAVNTVRVGYARCSTDEQHVVIQTEQLLGLGVPEDRIYIDRGSGTTRRNRGGLDQALAAGPHSVFTVRRARSEARPCGWRPLAGSGVWPTDWFIHSSTWA